MPPINVFHPQRGVFDPEAGIPIAALTSCDALTFYLSDIPPQGTVHAHAHSQGDEVYLILSGQGCLYRQAPGEERQSVSVAAGDLLRVPAEQVHQLVNLGEQPLRLLFVCRASHLSDDRVLHQDLREVAP
ncbi:MAG: cupin domain-containing protein [Paludibacterium sp.]|uniref:cupin domain-containing protein n=1 Tax=Paludibacterium sp. TaxID=1917523 RepID=UPI0025DA466F|nr:cupin domain-containing protein [Paludibacterium sp.]MBV8048592.1 cupin domain-containing protein [Paludibacterium sp.]MBV8647942.1 cupin domain-containing protein [Paludibacterium sp.]